METSSYVSLSGQLALERRMETIAQNIANATTPGYRAGGVQFSSLLSRVAPEPTEFASTGKNFMVEQSGGFMQTDNPLDVAIQGDAFLSFEGPQGVFYSRDGRLTVSSEGQLMSVAGNPVLDAGGGQLAINPTGGQVSIGRNGSITQDGTLRGTLGMFKINTNDGFARVENSGVIPTREAEAISSFAANGVMQGYIEQSNVNPITEMVRLIQVTRNFEAASNLAERAQDAEKAAIQAFAR